MPVLTEWSQRTSSSRTSPHYRDQPLAQTFHSLSTCGISSDDVSENVNVSQPTKVNWAPLPKRNGTGCPKCYWTCIQDRATSNSCMFGGPRRFYPILVILLHAPNWEVPPMLPMCLLRTYITILAVIINVSPLSHERLCFTINYCCNII